MYMSLASFLGRAKLFEDVVCTPASIVSRLADHKMYSKACAGVCVKLGPPNLGTGGHITRNMGTGGAISLGIWGPGVPITPVIWGAFSDLGTPKVCVAYVIGKDM